MKNLLCMCFCIVVMACVTGSWAAQNCPNGQPLFTPIFDEEGSTSRIWYANGKWYFDIKALAKVTLNCDRSPCVTTLYGYWTIYDDRTVPLFTCSGNPFPADPWCDDGDMRTITFAAAATQFLEPVIIRFWVDGIRVF